MKKNTDVWIEKQEESSNPLQILSRIENNKWKSV